MKLRYAVLLGMVVAAGICASAATREEPAPPRSLPAPQVTAGKPLMQALNERQSRRAFRAQALPPQVLANLLWAACGVNRPASGKRTAPSAVNWQEIDVYVALPDGLFLYDARTNALQPVLAEDIRSAAGRQRFVSEAPAVLIYVADRSRMGSASDTDKDFYSAVDTGFISQNVYLFCASANLATVVLGMVDRPALAKKMGLRADQRIILTQPVGYPAE